MRHLINQDAVQTSYRRQVENSARKYPHEGNRTYTFDVRKASEIFDLLQKASQIKLPVRHKMPKPEKLRGKDYCKYHNSWRHSTNNCLVFRNVLQEKIDRGILKFPEPKKKEMAVDKYRFPATVNVASANLTCMSRVGNGRHDLLGEEVRPWLDFQKQVCKAKRQSDQRPPQEGSGQNFSQKLERLDRPRMVRPPSNTRTNEWRRMEHPKFPSRKN